MKSKTLVQSWLEVELIINGKSLTSALKALNNSLGSAHTHSRVREWESNRNGRGDRLPRKIRLYMAKKVISHVLADAGVDTKHLTTRAVNKIAERIC